MRPAAILLTAAAVAATSAFAPLSARAGGVCHTESGARTVALIELYTSEGCDSCPPADRWLSRAIPPGASADAIAVAFHVDYWDRLGWKDRFASAQYTERQYDAMRMNGGRFVYTPQLLVGGHDFGEWRSAERPSRAIAAINAKPARARIALDATVAGDHVQVSADAKIDDATAARRATLAVALIDNGLVSDVKSGENAGARLSHDHVARRFASGFAADHAAAHASLDWPLPKEAGHAPTLIAFVQDPTSGDVLQALALPIDACAATR